MPKYKSNKSREIIQYPPPAWSDAVAREGVEAGSCTLQQREIRKLTGVEVEGGDWRER